MELEKENRRIEELIKELKANQSKWISVNDRLPKEGERVLVEDTRCPSPLIASLSVYNDCMSWLDDDDEWYCFGAFTHWMQLPPPPTEESTETEKEDKQWKNSQH